MSTDTIAAILMVTFLVGSLLACWGGELLGWWER